MCFYFTKDIIRKTLQRKAKATVSLASLSITKAFWTNDRFLKNRSILNFLKAFNKQQNTKIKKTNKKYIKKNNKRTTNHSSVPNARRRVFRRPASGSFGRRALRSARKHRVVRAPTLEGSKCLIGYIPAPPKGCFLVAFMKAKFSQKQPFGGPGIYSYTPKTNQNHPLIRILNPKPLQHYLCTIPKPCSSRCLFYTL